MRTVCLIFVLVTAVSICALAGDAGQSGSVGAAAASLTSSRQHKTFQTHEFLITLPDSAPEQRSFVMTTQKPIYLAPGTVVDAGSTCLRIRTYQVKRSDNSDSTEPAGYTTCVRSNQFQMKSAAGSNRK